jgi:transcriptional regulator
MYLPAHFQSKDLAYALDLMRDYPFATLISNDDQGFPFVSHIPIHVTSDLQAQSAVDATELAPPFKLSAHLARANPQVAYLKKRPQVLVSFLGPQAYMSPSVYQEQQHVPTWSYLAVHVKGHVQFVEDLQVKDSMLKQLIADHEPSYAKQWNDLPLTYRERMLSAIEAFEIVVTDWQCKIKLNQHRAPSHEAMHESYAKGSEQERALAQWMVRLGLVEL